MEYPSEEELRIRGKNWVLENMIQTLMLLQDENHQYYLLMEAHVHLMASEIDLKKELDIMEKTKRAMSLPTFPRKKREDLEKEVNQHLVQCAQLDLQHIDSNLQRDSIGSLVALTFRAHHYALELPRRAFKDNRKQEIVDRVADALVVAITICLSKPIVICLTRPPNSGLSFEAETTKRAVNEIVREYYVAGPNAKGDLTRDEFLDKAQLKPPKVVRVIDCKATCKKKQVVLRDWEDACVQETGYCAISHTYGELVYGVFDCICATHCLAKEPRCNPLHSHNDDGADVKHREVVQDILDMCTILEKAGVVYAWHDGVCIAQHNDSEVTNTIGHIGWIYSNANETIVFLHYVGKPMAPIGPSDAYTPSNGEPSVHVPEMLSRWQTRVWTIQEAALSKSRRYCVRVRTNQHGDCTTPLGDCKSMDDFEKELARWYDPGFSEVDVIKEEKFLDIVSSMKTTLLSLKEDADSSYQPRIYKWQLCLEQLLTSLWCACTKFPTFERALFLCNERDSKHEGDRINSILTLAGVTGFAAPKDSDLEGSTLALFEKQGKRGLLLALFLTNLIEYDDSSMSNYIARRHTWLPVLTELLVPLLSASKLSADGLHFTVLGDGKLRVTGRVTCIKVRFKFMALMFDACVGHEGVIDSIDESYGLKSVGHEGVIDSIDESYGLKSIGHDRVLNMEMKCDLSMYIKVTLSESPLIGVGTFLLPFFNSFPTTNLTIDGRHIVRYGETFLVHMVLMQDPCSDISKPVLVVQGESLDGEVSKIGVFWPNPKPWHVCYSNLKDSHKNNVTIVEKLVIK